MEAVGRLAGGIAHDFNNLLTAISGYSEFLIAGLEDERQRRHADEIRKAAARAASLTGQLLAFSRRQVLQPRVLDLNSVVTDMDMMLRRLIGEDVELIALLDTDLGAVLADPTQIEQVIVNLVVNARDAMPHGGSLTIETANVETDDGPDRRAAHQRHRHRDDRRRARTALRPVLHDEGGRHRARARDRLRSRRAERRHDRGRLRARAWARRSASACRARATARRATRRRSATAPPRSVARRRSCSSRTRRWCASSSRRSSRPRGTPSSRPATARRRSSCFAGTAIRSTCCSPTSSCPG